MARKPGKIKNIERRKKIKRINKPDDNYSTDFPGGEKSIQIVNTVPIIQEEFSVSKETTCKEAKIEKRWVTKTKIVKVPISYEEVYINDKKMKSVEEPQILSFLKDKISSIGRKSNSTDTDMKQSEKKKSDAEYRGELVPLNSSSNSNSSETEKVIPLWAEEIEVSKNMVKVAEIVIKKRRVTETKKIDIDIKKEQVTIKYPDGKTERL